MIWRRSPLVGRPSLVRMPYPGSHEIRNPRNQPQDCHMSFLSHANHVLPAPADPSQIWHYLFSVEHTGVLIASILVSVLAFSYGSARLSKSHYDGSSSPGD